MSFKTCAARIPDASRPPATGALASVLALIGLILLLAAGSLPAHAVDDLPAQRIASVFPDVDRVDAPAGEHGVRAIHAGGKLVGHAFRTLPIVDIPAYSGKPIDMHVVLDTDGVIRDAYVLEHHEPILLIGIPEQKLHDFNAGYSGIRADQRVVVGRSRDPAAVTVDAVSGATVTVMVINEVVMRAAREVAAELGLIRDVAITAKPAMVRADVYEPADWTTLTGNGAVRRLHLTRGDVDAAFAGSEAEGVDAATPETAGDTFIDLYAAHLNAPTIGRNLLGENGYRFLMEELKPDEHAIAVMGRGEYSFKGSGYVRGGIFDRVQLRQHGDVVSFRDMDHERLHDILAAGAPDFDEMSVFIVRDHHEFDPGAPWSLELLVRRQTGPVDSVFTSFELGYQLPEDYLDRPQPTAEELAAAAEAERPVWVNVWYQRSFQIGVICVALALLTVILFLQDKFTRRPAFLHWLRRGYLVFTVVFIGWYALGQLSIVNVLTFAHSLVQGFHWELFLSDPVIFILWTFTAASILLWGRGVFCGWLCPFGALQELVNEAARKLKVRQYELPFAVHERLWAVKYIVLLVLFGISLESLSTAEHYAEVEPFKTAITLRFDRQWWFVAYAAAWVVVSIFTRKVYCRYVCPLGAALAIPTKLRLFDWLKRRKECGQPCQVCANECEIQAIHPDGRINANECHYCLDCQMTYHNENKCPPLVLKNKKRRKREAAARDPRVIPLIPQPPRAAPTEPVSQ
ncbi:MAG: NosR/NirI family protein [Pseudazoarcus pumilus]|nr:NosR/NirI family protein [Pseudazoarcus pumilus]